MRRFIQHHFSHRMLKTVVGCLLFFIDLYPGYRQCVECDGTTITAWFSRAIGRYTQAAGNYLLVKVLLSSSKFDASFI